MQRGRVQKSFAAEKSALLRKRPYGQRDIVSRPPRQLPIVLRAPLLFQNRQLRCACGEVCPAWQPGEGDAA